MSIRGKKDVALTPFDRYYIEIIYRQRTFSNKSSLASPIIKVFLNFSEMRRFMEPHFQSLCGGEAKKSKRRHYKIP